MGRQENDGKKRSDGGERWGGGGGGGVTDTVNVGNGTEGGKTGKQERATVELFLTRHPETRRL